MSLCASCGLQVTVAVAAELCPHHHGVYGDDWSTTNRIWNDYFMRGIEPTRLSPAERETDFWMQHIGDIA